MRPMEGRCGINGTGRTWINAVGDICMVILNFEDSLHLRITGFLQETLGCSGHLVSLDVMYVLLAQYRPLSFHSSLECQLIMCR